ncbi:MAG: DNA starvation/stationary phase protection protein [Planctomycetota bacterium]
MSTAQQPMFKRSIISESQDQESAELLQQPLFSLIDLALMLKQAHWNLVGLNFQSLHVQLDEIIDSVRDASDEVAERMVTLGMPAVGRSSKVAENTTFSAYPDEFLPISDTLYQVGDALKGSIETLRAAIERVGDLDPITEDLLIGHTAVLEKHLWMIQAQEV